MGSDSEANGDEDTRRKQHSRPRVLIVDDDLIVLSSIRRLVSRQYDPVPISDPRDALARVTSGDRFDVIVCDLMMPGLTGAELHTAIATVAPDQAERMLFLTGDIGSLAARAFFERVANRRLEKPFEPSDLLAAITAVAGITPTRRS